MNDDDARPTVWPPPPTSPELEPPTQRVLSFGNELLGSLSPLCMTLGIAIAVLARFLALLAQFLFVVAYVGGAFVLAGFVLGILSWRTPGGKIGLGIAAIALLVGLLLSL